MHYSLIVLITEGLIAFSSLSFAQPSTESPKPRLIQLDQSARASSDVFTGPPGTVTMHSGYIVLAPGRSVGKHSTKGNEEAVLVFAGKGEMRITGGPTFSLAPSRIAYVPPMTEHDVVNTGPDTLRYVWLVAKAQP